MEYYYWSQTCFEQIWPSNYWWSMRMNAEAEAPNLWPPYAKSWLIGKYSDSGRDLGQEEKGTTEDEMAGWHHRLDGHEFEFTPGVGDGQGGLVCCDSWGCKESDTTEWLNWLGTNLNKSHVWLYFHFFRGGKKKKFVSFYLGYWSSIFIYRTQQIC